MRRYAIVITLALAAPAVCTQAVSSAPARAVQDGGTRGSAVNPPAGAMSTQHAAAIGLAIMRQIQPCADRQVNPGPGAERIRVEVALQLNRDGSLARPPRIVRHEGVDEANQHYVPKVDEAVRAIFTECSPLGGLPAELYDVPRGWKSFTLRYRLKN